MVAHQVLAAVLAAVVMVQVLETVEQQPQILAVAVVAVDGTVGERIAVAQAALELL